MSDLYTAAQEAPAPFPMIRGLLARKRWISLCGSLGVLLLGGWLAWRTGFAELMPIALVLAGVAHLVLRVAIEVVELVAETLMPR